MIDPQKVKAMSRNAKFEHNRGREALRIKKYCEDMPVWKSLVRSALAGILLYLIILIIFVMAFTDWVISIYGKLGDLWTIILVAGTLAIFAVLYSIISDAIFRKKYRKIRNTLCGYKSDSKILERINREQKTNETAG